MIEKILYSFDHRSNATLLANKRCLEKM